MGGSLEDAILLATEAHRGQVDKAGEPYIAREVKLADLEHNMDVTRLASIGEHDAARLAKYVRQWRRLAGRSV